MPTRTRKRNRLKGYDYNQAGYYFVTICTKHRCHYFGQIERGQALNSIYGEIAERFWREIPDHYLNVKLDEFIVMPNHIHGIIIIQPSPQAGPTSAEIPSIGTGHGPSVGTGASSVGTGHGSSVGTGASSVGTGHCPVPTEDGITPAKVPFYGQVSKVIRAFKEAVTKTIRNQYHDHEFGWQRSFYDHIIRSEASLRRIRRYIRNNPLRWELDKDNPANLYM